jgi:hypothetical protein
MSDTPKDGPGRNAGKGGGRFRAAQQAADPAAGVPTDGTPAAQPEAGQPGPVAADPEPAAPVAEDVVAERIPAEPSSPAADAPAATRAATPAARRMSLAVPVVAGAALVVLVAAWMVYASRPEGEPVDANQLAALSTRVDRAEQVVGGLPPQLQRLEQRLGGLETAQGNAVKPEAVQALRDGLAQQQAAQAGVQQRADARIAEAETALSQRITGAEAQLAQRVAASEAALAPKLAAIDTAQQQRLDGLRDSLQQRMDAALKAQQDRADAALKALQDAAAQQQSKDDARLAALESREQRLAAAEQRLNRLVASTAVTTALEAGRPLGASLAGLPGTVPPALAAYATAAPPTGAQLRLSFDDAARAARAASEPQTTGQGVLEAAATRLSNLVTVRRGDQTVWGDNASGALEGARQALDAGDLAGAVQKVEALPPTARAPMEEWLKQARGLLAARAALAELVAPRGQG